MKENESLEEILKNLREKRNWSYAEFAQKINDKLIEKENQNKIIEKPDEIEVDSSQIPEEKLKIKERERQEAEWKLREKLLADKDVKKWEYGLIYPDLDMLYIISELFDISCDDLLRAKNISFKKGFPSTRTIKWICYYLNVSIWVGFAINICIIVLAFILAMVFFRFALMGLARALANR